MCIIVCNCNAYNLLFSWEDNDRNKININLVTKTQNMYYSFWFFILCGLFKFRENHKVKFEHLWSTSKTSEMNSFFDTTISIGELKILRFWLWLYKRINARKYLGMNAHNTSGTTLSCLFLYTSQSVRSAILTQPSMKPFVHQVTRWILIPQINCTSLEYICRSSDGPREITENQVLGYLKIVLNRNFSIKKKSL